MFLEIVSSCIRYNVYQNDAGSGYDDDFGACPGEKMRMFLEIVSI